MSISNNVINKFGDIRASILGDTVKSYKSLIWIGILFLVLGGIGIFGQTMLSFVTVNFLGFALIIGGGLQFAYAIKADGWKSVTWQIILAIIYVIAGISILVFPIPALEVLTLWLGFAFLATGVLRLIVAFQYRQFDNWFWLVVSAALSILMSILVLNSFPEVSLWLPGFLISIEMLLQGWSLLFMGFSARKLANDLSVKSK